MSVSKGRKLFQMTIKYMYQYFSIPRLSKIFPNWDFWYENVPSGNPGMYVAFQTGE
jgi:hypothetical protein